MPSRSSPRRALAPLSACAVLLAVGGCNIIGAIASKVPKPDIAAAYPGLAGQSVGVMVWADQGERIDWPSVQLDIANGVDRKLKEAQTAKAEELKLSTFPVEPRSIVRYQREHPEVDASPVINIAPKLGVQRLLYVELKNLSTRSEEAITLFRGDGVVSLRVIEIDPAGTAKVVFEEQSIHVTFPRHAPPEGVLNANDSRIYAGTLDMLTTEIVKRVITHPDDTP